MRLLIALLSGALFGAGLLLSGMTDTQKVQGWLDIFGAWDPTLAFVMGGAILPMLVAWRMTKTRQPVTCGTFPAPARPELDRGLILGSVLFGAGWGLVGLCPGPAMAALSYGGTSSAVFLVAMAAGMRLAPGLLTSDIFSYKSLILLCLGCQKALHGLFSPAIVSEC